MSKLESYPTLEAAAKETGIKPTKAMLAAWEASKDSDTESDLVSVQLTEDGDAESRQLDVVTIKGIRKFDGCSVVVTQEWFRTPDNTRWRGYETETMVWLRGHRKWDEWLDEMPDDSGRYAEMHRRIYGETHDETIRWRNGNAGIWVLTGDHDRVRDRILAVCDERREARRSKVREARAKIESPTVRMGLALVESSEETTVWESRCGEYRIVELTRATNGELTDCWIEQHGERVPWTPAEFENSWDVHEALEKHLMSIGRL